MAKRKIGSVWSRNPRNEYDESCVIVRVVRNIRTESKSKGFVWTNEVKVIFSTDKSFKGVGKTAYLMKTKSLIDSWTHHSEEKGVMSKAL